VAATAAPPTGTESAETITPSASLFSFGLPPAAVSQSLTVGYLGGPNGLPSVAVPRPPPSAMKPIPFSSPPKSRTILGGTGTPRIYESDADLDTTALLDQVKARGLQNVEATAAHQRMSAAVGPHMSFETTVLLTSETPAGNDITSHAQLLSTSVFLSASESQASLHNTQPVSLEPDAPTQRVIVEATPIVSPSISTLANEEHAAPAEASVHGSDSSSIVVPAEPTPSNSDVAPEPHRYCYYYYYLLLILLLVL
jgi:hypothetical protein